ncbi:ThiJ/PfpI domain-containing protein [Gorgonomyces haynaldii]|nr:ThiJ/PfpI domain-containing protein [Gorgonomyces haynaldii]
MRISLLVFDGVDEIDFVGPMEVLRSSTKIGTDVDLKIVTLKQQATVKGSHGLMFQPDAVFEPGKQDLLLIPGGNWVARSSVGAFGEVQRGQILEAIREARQVNPELILASVCTGSMILAHAGLLQGKKVTTHHSAFQDMEALGIHLVKERIVDDGNVITSGGVTSGIDLGLYLLKRFYSQEISNEIRDRIEHFSA